MVEIPGEALAEKVIEGVNDKAGNPWWVIGFLLIGGAIFVCCCSISLFVYVVKPATDAQIDAVRANISSIQSNAETNRKMGEAIGKISDSIESINGHLRDSTSEMRKVVTKLEATEEDQDKALNAIKDCMKQK